MSDDYLKAVVPQHPVAMPPPPWPSEAEMLRRIDAVNPRGCTHHGRQYGAIAEHPARSHHGGESRGVKGQ